MMFQTKLFKFTLLTLLLIAVLYILEVIFYLNWTIWWYDMVLHFLAGVSIGTTTLIVMRELFGSRLSGYFKLALTAIACAFLIGVLWEIFELYFGLVIRTDEIAYMTDTTTDLMLDMAGAFFGVLYGRKSA